jgi:lipopolysaccharide/colanic/teichoic acid biosynthesis glycosyltransferase
MENSTATHPHRHRLNAGKTKRFGSRGTEADKQADSRSVYTGLIKRAIDVSVSLALLLILSPLMVLVALAVRLDSRGPALFRQRRLGLGMEPFMVLKFRTMAVDASPDLHRRFVAELANARSNGDGVASREIKKLTADPRVTSVGRFLRRTSLDELPQLFNVLAGTMSLVGPRPALEYELEHYAPSHYGRFDVRPGITGLWQVSGRNRLDFHQMLELDAEYSADPTLATDLAILVRTPLAAIRHAA